MVKIFTSMLCLFLLCSCAHIAPRDYTNREKLMYAGMLTAHGIDCGTTDYALHHGGVEVNPIFANQAPGETMRNIVITHVALIGIKTVVMYYWPETRSPLMWWAIIPHGIAGGHNAFRIYQYEQGED